MAPSPGFELPLTAIVPEPNTHTVMNRSRLIILAAFLILLALLAYYDPAFALALGMALAAIIPIYLTTNF